MENPQAAELLAQIKANLVRAIKVRNGVEVSTYRSLLARISNAEAVSTSDQSAAAFGPIAGAGAGVGSTEAPRKQLTYADLQQIIRDEIEEIQAAKQGLNQSSDYAIELGQKMALLRPILQ